MRRRLVQALGLAAVLAIVVGTLRDRVPSPGEIGAALRQADPRWLAVAAAAEFVSMGMFARQQRRLLTAFGVTLQRRRILALSYSRSAISISLPPVRPCPPPTRSSSSGQAARTGSRPPR